MLHRRARGLAGDRHPPALGLYHVVVTGAMAREAEAGDRAPGQSRIRREHRGRTQSSPLERSRAEVLDHDVGLTGEALDEALILEASEVDRDAELVAIRGEVVGRFPASVEGRTPPARLVPTLRTLDFDDIRAEVTEGHRGQRSGKNSRQVQYSDAAEWFSHDSVSMMLLN